MTDLPSSPEPAGDGVVRPPGPLDHLLLPASALETTLRGLALGRDREMLCYWVGTALPYVPGLGRRAWVTTVAFPRIYSGYDYFRLAEGEMARLTSWCSDRELWILAQVHTHPTDEPHSAADEGGPFSHRPGFISVVIPYFAQFATLRDPQWRAHELRQGGSWSEIDPYDRFQVVSDVWISGGQ
jgi:hypothetical protein